MSAAIARGEDVAFKIKYTFGSLGTKLDAYDGLVTVSKTAVAFRPTVGAKGFSVSPDKILEVKLNQPSQALRVNLRVALKNQKSGKEDKKDFEFYYPAVFLNGFRINCNECDDSMNRLHAILTSVRNGN